MTPRREHRTPESTTDQGAEAAREGRERQPADAAEVEDARRRAEDLERTNRPIDDTAGLVPTRRQDSTGDPDDPDPGDREVGDRGDGDGTAGR